MRSPALRIKRPLAEKTLKRIARGVRKYVHAAKPLRVTIGGAVYAVASIEIKSGEA